MLFAKLLTRSLLATSYVALVLVWPSQSHAGGNDLPPCDLSKTNMSCVLEIDRRTPVAPPTVQMYSGQSLTVSVTHPLSYERYFLDYSTGAANLNPDLSTIVQGLFPSLGALSFGPLYEANVVEGKPQPPAPDPCAVGVVAGTDKPARKNLHSALPPFQACLFAWASKARLIYQQLEPYVAPDTITSHSVAQQDLTPADIVALQTSLNSVLNQEFAVSANITTLTGDDSYKAKAADPGKPDAKPPVKPTPAIPVAPSDAEAITELTNMQKVADAVAADLMGYRQRIAELAYYHNDSIVSLTSRPDCVIHAMSVHGFTASRSSISRHAGHRFHAMSVHRFMACRSSS